MWNLKEKNVSWLFLSLGEIISSIMWLVKHKCPTLTGGVFLTFLTQYLSKFKTNLNLNGGYPKKCKEKNEIDLEALYIPGQAKKQKNCPTLTFSFFGLYFIISWS